MSSPVIRVENLGKRYRIGIDKPPAKTLGGKIRNAVASPFDWLATQMRPPTEEETLWALRDVSFQVQQGEVLGIIGANGAGKSTLLKILSRITEPSTGFAEIGGRVGALLEVGTGMHPELTGRENIYQNGCILGMRKWEIDKKFDEIVDFSGIERFIDTPVKRYSSGQRVRLGFAIAAHLEPEILIIDEVLAVGDANFQKKCLGKMKDVAGHGRTVLFVSHNMAAVQQLCNRAILLENGSTGIDAPPQQAIEHYFKESAESANASLKTRKQRAGVDAGNLEEISIRNPQGKTRGSFLNNAVIDVVIQFSLPEGCENGSLAFTVYDAAQYPIFHCDTKTSMMDLPPTAPKGSVKCRLKLPNLYPGNYYINLSLRDGFGKRLDRVERACRFTVTNSGEINDGRLPIRDGGPILVEQKWSKIA